MTSRSPTLQEVLNTHRAALFAGLRVALPGKVERYDAATQLADVKPQVKETREDEDGERVSVSLPVLTNVPIVFPGAGGFHITFPVQVGDTVLLVFADRSIDAWQAQGVEVDPADLRRHSLSDAVAIPGLHANNATIAGVDSGVITIGSDTGPADFVALAAKVATELSTLIGVYNLHTHVESGTTTAPPVGQMAPAGSVASATVKVKG